jgi:hypothetical protein
MTTYVKNEIAKMIKRNLDIDIDPKSIVSVNRGYFRSYPEAYRWSCKEISGEKRRLWCAASQNFCLFMGGFDDKLYYELGFEWEINVTNKNNHTVNEIMQFGFHKKR